MARRRVLHALLLLAAGAMWARTAASPIAPPPVSASASPSASSHVRTRAHAHATVSNASVAAAAPWDTPGHSGGSAPVTPVRRAPGSFKPAATTVRRAPTRTLPAASTQGPAAVRTPQSPPDARQVVLSLGPVHVVLDTEHATRVRTYVDAVIRWSGVACALLLAMIIARLNEMELAAEQLYAQVQEGVRRSARQASDMDRRLEAGTTDVQLKFVQLLRQMHDAEVHGQGASDTGSEKGDGSSSGGKERRAASAQAGVVHALRTQVDEMRTSQAYAFAVNGHVRELLTRVLELQTSMRGVAESILAARETTVQSWADVLHRFTMLPTRATLASVSSTLHRMHDATVRKIAEQVRDTEVSILAALAEGVGSTGGRTEDEDEFSKDDAHSEQSEDHEEDESAEDDENEDGEADDEDEEGDEDAHEQPNDDTKEDRAGENDGSDESGGDDAPVQQMHRHGAPHASPVDEIVRTDMKRSAVVLRGRSGGDVTLHARCKALGT